MGGANQLLGIAYSYIWPLPNYISKQFCTTFWPRPFTYLSTLDLLPYIWVNAWNKKFKRCLKCLKIWNFKGKILLNKSILCSHHFLLDVVFALQQRENPYYIKGEFTFISFLFFPFFILFLQPEHCFSYFFFISFFWRI